QRHRLGHRRDLRRRRRRRRRGPFFREVPSASRGRQHQQPGHKEPRPRSVPHAPRPAAIRVPATSPPGRRPLPATQRTSRLAPVRFEAAATTDPGLRRPDNEDAYLLDTERGLFCVADGMGGHAAGEVASRLAVEALAREMARPDAGAPLDARLRAAVAAANRAILEAAGRDPTLVGMGTTLTALALATDDRSFTIAHIGDSRAYLYRQGALTQLTADHTWVQQQVDAGLLTPEEARRHPLASMLTRALGISDDPDVDIIHGELEPGDLILRCSDGRTGRVDDAELAAILARADLPLDGLARELTAAGNRTGGMDNTTAILIRAAA